MLASTKNTNLVSNRRRCVDVISCQHVNIDSCHLTLSDGFSSLKSGRIEYAHKPKEIEIRFYTYLKDLVFVFRGNSLLCNTENTKSFLGHFFRLILDLKFGPFVSR